MIKEALEIVRQNPLASKLFSWLTLFLLIILIIVLSTLSYKIVKSSLNGDSIEIGPLRISGPTSDTKETQPNKADISNLRYYYVYMPLYVRELNDCMEAMESRIRLMGYRNIVRNSSGIKANISVDTDSILLGTQCAKVDDVYFAYAFLISNRAELLADQGTKLYNSFTFDERASRQNSIKNVDELDKTPFIHRVKSINPVSITMCTKELTAVLNVNGLKKVIREKYVASAQFEGGVIVLSCIGRYSDDSADDAIDYISIFGYGQNADVIESVVQKVTNDIN